jgi:hypothetical protein
MPEVTAEAARRQAPCRLIERRRKPTGCLRAAGRCGPSAPTRPTDVPTGDRGREFIRNVSGAESRRAARRPAAHWRHAGCGQLAPTDLRTWQTASAEVARRQARGRLIEVRTSQISRSRGPRRVRPIGNNTHCGHGGNDSGPESDEHPAASSTCTSHRTSVGRWRGNCDRLAPTRFGDMRGCGGWRRTGRRGRSPGQPSTTLRSAWPPDQRARLSMKNRAWRNSQSATRSLMCGVISTLSNRQSGLSGGSGSLAKTSR